MDDSPRAIVPALGRRVSRSSSPLWKLWRGNRGQSWRFQDLPRHQREGTPTASLMRCIQHKDWDEARKRIRLYPQDAEYRSRGNRKSTLHLALMNRAPHDIVERLVDAWPTALYQQDTEGWTPLHVSILYGSEEETTILLIRRGGRIGACLHSRYCGSALHLACRHGCSNAVLKELLRVSPNQVRVSNEAGATPANLMWKTFVRQHSVREPSEAQILLEQLSLLLDGSNGLPLETRPYPSLSRVMEFQNRFADGTDFVSLLLRFHPAALQDLGRFPLHRAAAYVVFKDKGAFGSIEGFVSPSAPRDPLCVLVERLPPSAAGTMDHFGRMPLHFAVSDGQRRWRTGHLAELVQACPEACLHVDPVTGLFPFQLAAVPQSEPPRLCCPQLEVRRDKLVLETIFELLRVCPEAARIVR